MDTHHVCFWYTWTFHCRDLYNKDTSLLDRSLSLYISTATIWTTRLKRPLSETSFNMDTLELSIWYVYNLKSQKRSSDIPVLFHQPTNIQAKQIIRIIIIITNWLVLFYKNVTMPLLLPRLGLGSNCSRQHCIANNLVEGYLISYTP